MGTLGMPVKDLAYAELNGAVMTEARVLSWAKAIAKAEQMVAAGFDVIDAYPHPITGFDVIVIPSTSNAGATYHNIQTRTGYHCPCAASDACWHSAYHMQINEPMRARAILSEACQITANRASAKRAARVDAMPLGRPSGGPRLYR